MNEVLNPFKIRIICCKYLTLYPLFARGNGKKTYSAEFQNTQNECMTPYLKSIFKFMKLECKCLYERDEIPMLKINKTEKDIKIIIIIAIIIIVLIFIFK